ncbi:MAG: hypothetical protein QF926_09500 [Alphaproteobacteria bacterium]|nr:hypothetical protein [Alphaproteobacteria bacterium]MDP6516839.1 hypothetical protein [Alphaproteobacteria bacterium]
MSVNTVAVPPSQARPELPPEIAALPPGAELAGVIAPGPAEDDVLLRTDAGTVRLRTAAELPAGSEVVIRLDEAASRLGALVISIDGRRPPDGPPPQVILAPASVPAPVITAPVAATGTPEQSAPRPAPGPAAMAVAGAPIEAAPALDLAALAPGARIAGTVVADSQTGHLLLGTESGVARIHGRAPLAAGSRVVLEVDTVHPRLLASLISVDGRPGPEGGASLVLSPVGPEAIAAQRAAASQLSAGAVVTGTVIATNAPSAVPTAPGRAPPPSAGPVLPLGASLSVRVTTIDSGPAIAPNTGSGSGAAAVPNKESRLGVAVAANTESRSGAAAVANTESRSGATAVPNTEPRSGAAAEPNRAPGSGTMARVQAPAAAAPTGSSRARPTIAATVAGHDSDGLALVRVPGATFRLATPAPLPAGATVTLEILTIGPPPAIATGETIGAIPTDPLAGLSRDWPALREAVTTLARVDAPAGQSVTQNVLPNTTPSGLANLIGYLFGLQLGNGAAWLGEQASRALERAGRADLVERIADDFAQLSVFTGDVQAADWRLLPFPFFDGQHLHQVLAFLRQHEEDSADGEVEPGGTRLVIDIELSRLGALQLDGYYNNPRFDLFVRSRKPLDAGVRHDILAIFDDMAAASELLGGVTFQVMRRFPVTPLDEIAAAGGHRLLI